MEGGREGPIRDASSAEQGLIGCEVGTGLNQDSHSCPVGSRAEAWGGRRPREGDWNGQTPKTRTTQRRGLNCGHTGTQAPWLPPMPRDTGPFQMLCELLFSGWYVSNCVSLMIGSYDENNKNPIPTSLTLEDRTKRARGQAFHSATSASREKGQGGRERRGLTRASPWSPGGLEAARRVSPHASGLGSAVD